MNSGKFSSLGLKSFVRNICRSQKIASQSIEHMLSVGLSDGVTRPIGDYPKDWLDEWHEEDGGHDSIGVRPQMGVTLLKKEMNGLGFKGGYEAAWDDVTNAALLPDLVKEARKVEMGQSDQ